jgi:dihydrolipoamide dehydrogenase
MSETKKFDVVVIGGGSGLTAAYLANKDGKSVALVESRPDAMGGTCVNRGCIPTKGLIQSAEVMKTIRGAQEFGIRLDQSSVRADFKAIMDTVRRRRTKGAEGSKKWVEEALSPFYSRARFVSEKVLELEDGTRPTGERIFIAAGARPAVPPITGLEDAGYWTNESVLELDERPESLIILGGGYIGCELGHFFSAMGTRVTVIDRSECLLREDDDVRALFTEEFGKRADLVLNADAREVGVKSGRIEVVVKEKGASERTLTGDALLVATGRRPNTDYLDLRKAGVETDDKGWVKVDEGLRTTHPDVYAYGDVIGRAMFKHTSSYEGEIAYKNSRGADLKVSYRANPHAVFTDPQIGSVGLTETECKDKGLSYDCVKKEYCDIAKGEIVGSPPGLAKLIVEKRTDRILGFHMIGPNAADLIHEVVVAMNAGDGTADLIRDTIHTHPTMPELIKEVFVSSRR